MAWVVVQIRALSRRRISATDSGISSPIAAVPHQIPLFPETGCRLG